MNSTLKRLYADYKRVSELFRNHPCIAIKSVSGRPPERYQIEYKIKGLVQKDGKIIERNRHIVEIVLTRGYPNQDPLCRMSAKSPVFHPNIDHLVICIADPGLWTPAESLADLIVRIGKMICYQSYNIKSPRNGEAAKWLEENLNHLPIDDIDLSLKKRPEEVVVTKSEIEKLIISVDKDKKKEPLEVCANCGTKDKELQRCINGHVVCADCVIECQSCNRNLCVLCSFAKCALCEKIICGECQATCSLCNQVMCKAHFIKCNVCSHKGCPKCITQASLKDHSDTTENICRACSSEIKAEVKISYEDINSGEVDKILAKDAFYKKYKK